LQGAAHGDGFVDDDAGLRGLQGDGAPDRATFGFEIVVLVTAVYAAVTEFALKSALWLVFGLGFAFVVGLVGAISGWVGGALAHPTSIIRSLRRYGPSA
jgi:hypothetical protein